MLNGIPRILTPDLVKILKELGHSDKIVTSDANFRLPVTSEIWKNVLAAML